jgi:hypothetical protein
MSTLTVTRKFSKLFEPCDVGEWSLPEPVMQARSTATRVTAALGRVPTLHSAQVPFTSAVAAALAAEHPHTIDVSGIVGHARTVEENDALVAVLRIAGERAEADLSVAVSENRDAMIERHLRPAGQKLWGEITKTVRALGDIEISDTDALLRASSQVRQAWLSLDGMAGKYVRIRQAVEQLLLHTGDQPEHDTFGDHSEFRQGLCVLVGSNWRSAPMAERRVMPWPTDPRHRLVWLVRNFPDPWWPTTEERDQVWLIAHREQHERMQNQQRRHRIAQSWATSY